jgi:hypothetical protein
MDAFARELMRRSPLAACVLEMSDFVFDDELLASVWDAHRGRCYEDVLKFPDFLRLMRDALVNHGGSVHRMFVDLERRDAEPVDESNFYRKLARTPVELSRALLREGTARLAELMPDEGGVGVALPACFDAFAVVVGDGKKIKNAAKRLAPTRGYSGKLLGAKALVALDARSGLALAMNDSLDGMTNDVPLGVRADGAVAPAHRRARDPVGLGSPVRRRGHDAAPVGAGRGRVRRARQAVARLFRGGINGGIDR